MTGLQRFERRWAHWLDKRDAMSWARYQQGRTAKMRKCAMAFLAAFFAALGLVTVVMAMALPAHAAGDVPAAAQRHKLTLKREAQRVWGLDAPVAVFAAQIHQESRWNPMAVSRVGARGLGQFMPATASWISDLYPASLAGADMTNPTWSIRALVTYNHWLHARVRTADNACERMAFTLSAYNGGLGWVYRRQARSAQPGKCLGATCTINPGIHPANQRENEHYPRVILLTLQPRYATWGHGVCA